MTSRRPPRRGWLLGVAVAGAGLGSLAASSPPTAGAQSSDRAIVVSADGEGAMTGGGGDTAFTLELPAGASCPGDSEHEDYRVQSFLVPASEDPATLVYQGLRPQVEGGWALYEVNTSSYINRATAPAAEAGGEGAIINVPAFSFAVFEPGMLPTGRVHIGIACSLFTETERHWSTEIDIVTDAEDPAGIAWTVVDPPAGAGRDRRVPTIAIGAALAALAIAAVVRRRSTVDPPAVARP